MNGQHVYLPKFVTPLKTKRPSLSPKYKPRREDYATIPRENGNAESLIRISADDKNDQITSYDYDTKEDEKLTP